MIREMAAGDWPRIQAIYQQGIDGNLATFTARVPEESVWNQAHARDCRIVCEENGLVVGFAALARHAGAPAYSGVAELSLYVDNAYHAHGVGSALLGELIARSEKAGFWTLESVITADNLPSVRLHEKFGFRLVGRRERISFTPDGVWHDTLVYERRSQAVRMDGPYRAPQKGLTLSVLPQTFCVVKLPEGKETLPEGVFSLTRTGDELSLLCEEQYAPKDALKNEAGYRALRVMGTLDFSLVGILADLTRVLKEISVSVFVVSTYDTDYVLVKEASLGRASDALERAGYEVL